MSISVFSSRGTIKTLMIVRPVCFYFAILCIFLNVKKKQNVGSFIELSDFRQLL